MATSFSDGRSRSTRRERPTMGKRLVNLFTCGCESSRLDYMLLLYDNILWIRTMFGSSYHPVVCRRVHVLIALFVFFAYSGVQHILCSVFVLFVFVWCALCWQFFWIGHSWLPLRFSLTVIYRANAIFLSLNVFLNILVFVLWILWFLLLNLIFKSRTYWSGNISTYNPNFCSVNNR
jgi:hypothetical protein